MLFEGIDLFCGAGGTTTGVHQAMIESNPIAKVVACINHDPIAIDSHKANHPEALHFVEDIREFDTKYLPKKNPEAYSFIWASLECTNFSNAKGGQPRDADSRTLAEHLYRYINSYDPDYILIENVREFMAWGPLNSNGKPISRLKGRDYTKWVKHIKSYGYNYEFKLLNAADFGAYTSRVRYFGCFAKVGLPIVWPQPTHSKKPVGNLKKWLPVRDVLNLEEKGQSIFTRNKPLSENTLKRIYAGLVKYVAKGDDSFIKKYFSGRPMGKVISLDGPAGTITTIDNQTLVQPEFFVKYYGNSDVDRVDLPAPTLTTKDRLALINCHWLDKQYSGERNHQSINSPSGSVLVNDKHCLVNAFISKYYKSGQQNQSVEEPSASITTVPKSSIVSVENAWLLDTNFSNTGNSLDHPSKTVLACRKHQYLMNPQFSSPGKDMDSPCFTLIARMDKKPPYLLTSEEGAGAIIIYEHDNETMKKIKVFMAAYGIVDIKMRMLLIDELKRIQGFSDDYVLEGTKTNQKKFIGNAVVPVIPKVWYQALALALINMESKLSLKQA